MSSMSLLSSATIRPAYADELGRARALLEGHPVPPSAAFIVAVKEHPVERLLAAVPCWLSPEAEGPDPARQLRFHLGSPSANGLNPELLALLLEQLEARATSEHASALATDFSLPEAHPLFTHLRAQGFEICKTDRVFAVPGEVVKSRTQRIHARLGEKLPQTWRLESIRGQDPEKLYAVVAAHGLMSRQQFQQYWNGANRERFEAEYSWVVLAEAEVLGLLLVSQQGEDELHIHVEAVSPGHHAQSRLLSASLRHASFSRCAAGFPKKFTCRADAIQHRQTGNSALRHGGEEGPPRHFLRKPMF